MTYIICVPAEGHSPATEGIAPGSAIVTSEGSGTNVRIYFEGATHGQSGMERLVDRALYAAQALRDRVPTTATRTVPSRSIIPVGVYSLDSREITLFGSPEARHALAAWLGVDKIEPVELGLPAI